MRLGRKIQKLQKKGIRPLQKLKGIYKLQKKLIIPLVKQIIADPGAFFSDIRGFQKFPY